MIGEPGNNIQLSSHCLNIAAQCTYIHISPLFHFSNRSLPYFQCAGNLFLGEPHRIAKFGKIHLFP